MPLPTKSTSLREVGSRCIQVRGLDITYGVIWYQIRQGSPPREEGKLSIRNHEEGKVHETTSLYFSLDMTCRARQGML